MKQFDYTIKDELGIHARPAGLLVKQAALFTSKITVKNGAKEADGKKLFAVMSLAVKKGQTVTVTVEGSDEEKAAKALQSFFELNV